jgi:phage/plasmid-like protein (TIGR03299 family)
VDENGFKICTAGTLKGGRRMWALAETGRFGEVTKDDKVGGYLLLSTSCDKTLATTARFTTIRVVCNNTLTAATANKGHTVSFSHIREFDHADVKMRLGGAVSTFGSFMEMAKLLQKQKMSIPAAKKFVEQLISPVAQFYKKDYSVDNNRAYKKILALFDEEAKGIELVGHTKWGMLNAVTEYYDHHNPSRSDDSRLDSAWFGQGERLKNKAVELLLA